MNIITLIRLSRASVLTYPCVMSPSLLRYVPVRPVSLRREVIKYARRREFRTFPVRRTHARIRRGRVRTPAPLPPPDLPSSGVTREYNLARAP